MHNSTRARSVLKASALMAAGGILLGGVALADLWFDDGRALYAAFGRDALARSCTAPRGSPAPRRMIRTDRHAPLYRRVGSADTYKRRITGAMRLLR